MVQRQHAERMVLLRPAPGPHQRRNLRLEIGVREHDALRPARGAARIENHGPAERVDLGQRDRRLGTPVRKHHESDAELSCRFGEPCTPFGGDDRGRASRIFQDEPQRRRRVAEAKGHGDSAGAPDGPLGADIVEARGNHEGHRRLPQVFPAAQQDRGETTGGFEQILVAEGGTPGKDRRASRIPPCAFDEFEHERTFQTREIGSFGCISSPSPPVAQDPIPAHSDAGGRFDSGGAALKAGTAPHPCRACGLFGAAAGVFCLPYGIQEAISPFAVSLRAQFGGWFGGRATLRPGRLLQSFRP